MDEMEKETWKMTLNQWKLLSNFIWFSKNYNHNHTPTEIKEIALSIHGIDHACMMCHNYKLKSCPLGTCTLMRDNGVACYRDYTYSDWERFVVEFGRLNYKFTIDEYMEIKYYISKLARKFYHELILRFIYRCSL